eukprot:108873-Rhodomonas_salina.2
MPRQLRGIIQTRDRTSCYVETRGCKPTYPSGSHFAQTSSVCGARAGAWAVFVEVSAACRLAPVGNGLTKCELRSRRV